MDQEVSTFVTSHVGTKAGDATARAILHMSIADHFEWVDL
jgi:hypothetical protein